MAVVRRSFEQSLLDKSDWGEVTWEALLVFFSTYAAPILFIFTFFSIAETLFDTPKWYNFSVLVCQVFGLDSAGAGLVTRGMRLCERGKGKAGAWAIVAGGFIVLVTVVSVACVAIPSAIPTAVVWTKPTEAILIIVRVVGSVCYGFILKLVKGASGDHSHPSPVQVQQTTQQIDALKTTIDNLSTELKALAAQKNTAIDYQKIADLVPAQRVPDLNYQEIAQQIVPLLVPPPLPIVPTTQDILAELKPYLDSLKPVVQPVPPERIAPLAAHPFLVPVGTKSGASNGAANDIYVPSQSVKNGASNGAGAPLYVPFHAIKNVPPRTTENGTKSGASNGAAAPLKMVRGGTKSGAGAPGKSGTKSGAKMTDEDRLEAAYREVVQSGKVPTQRGLEATTGIDRRKIRTWMESKGSAAS